MIHSILCVQFTCLKVLFDNLSPGPLWSSSWSWTLYFKALKKAQKDKQKVQYAYNNWLMFLKFLELLITQQQCEKWVAAQRCTKHMLHYKKYKVIMYIRIYPYPLLCRAWSVWVHSVQQYMCCHLASHFEYMSFSCCVHLVTGCNSQTFCHPQNWKYILLLHTFNSPFSGTTRVSWYQKGKTNLDFTEARDSEWQWHQLGHMQVCTSLQTDNDASTPSLRFYRPDALPAAQPTASKHWRHWKYITYCNTVRGEPRP